MRLPIFLVMLIDALHFQLKAMQKWNETYFFTTFRKAYAAIYANFRATHFAVMNLPISLTSIMPQWMAVMSLTNSHEPT